MNDNNNNITTTGSCGNNCGNCACDDTTHNMGKPLKIKFAPGVLDELMASMPIDEAQKIIDEISRMAATGELMDNAVPVDMELLQETEPDTYQNIIDQLDAPSPTLQ